MGGQGSHGERSRRECAEGAGLERERGPHGSRTRATPSFRQGRRRARFPAVDGSPDSVLGWLEWYRRPWTSDFHAGGRLGPRAGRPKDTDRSLSDTSGESGKTENRVPAAQDGKGTKRSESDAIPANRASDSSSPRLNSPRAGLSRPGPPGAHQARALEEERERSTVRCFSVVLPVNRAASKPSFPGQRWAGSVREGVCGVNG